MEIKGLSMAESLKMIKGVEGIAPIKGQALPETKANSDGVSFMDYLSKSVDQANQLNLDAEQRIQMAVAGEDESPHTTMIAIQKADVSFRLLLSVKEKLLSAYQQVIRTPIG